MSRPLKHRGTEAQRRGAKPYSTGSVPLSFFILGTRTLGESPQKNSFSRSINFVPDRLFRGSSCATKLGCQSRIPACLGKSSLPANQDAGACRRNEQEMVDAADLRGQRGEGIEGRRFEKVNVAVLTGDE